MAVSHGMNVDEVEALGKALQGYADQIRSILGDVGSRVDSTTWVGPDAEAFKFQWWPDHRSHLEKVAGDVQGFGQSALNNASEQRQASEVRGPAGSSAGPGGPSAGGSVTTTPAPPPGGGPVPKSVSIGLADVGHRYPTGWNQQGECVKSVQRWVNQAAGRDVYLGGGGPLTSLQNSGASRLADVNAAQPGDVIQIAKGDSWDGVPHTVLVTKNLGNGHFSIVQSNAPGWVNGQHITSGYDGLVTSVDDWSLADNVPAGESSSAWRF